MQQINFDNGIQEFVVNGSGKLRFNPEDPNVYDRFLNVADKLQEIEKTMEEKGKALGENDIAGSLRLLAEADRQIKEILSWVFGKNNDFDEIVGGVNLMTVTGNGERVITNLLSALTPILEKGAKKCAEQQIGDAVKQAQTNRAQRRAQK